jgi:hypothetical protein
MTSYAREQIRNAAIEHTFAPRYLAHKQEEDALARQAYAAVISPSEIKAAKSLPENWFRLDACLRFNANGFDITLHTIGEGLPVPYRAKGSDYGGHCARLGVIQPGELADAIKAHADAGEALKADRNNAKRALTALLESVTTLKALQAAWPEGEPFWSALAAKSNTPGLPAPLVADLNAMLGLGAAA